MRAVKDGLPARSGESEETEVPSWTRAVGDHLASPQGNGCRLAEIADHFADHAATVSCRLRQAEQTNVLLQDSPRLLIRSSSS